MYSQLQEKSIECPYCGECIDLLLEIIDEDQDYIEDCQVCCRPIGVLLTVLEEGEFTVTIKHENET
ncbi:MAG: hypothetical protein ACI9J2_001012 [Saprospiraceae bacterium]|jgi:hypothetical protein